MRSGRMRYRATVYTKAEDAYGDPSGSETLLGIFRCSMEPKYWQERSENGEVLSRVRYELRFRYSPTLASLNPDSEVVVDGKRLVVMTISDPTGKHHELRMLAEERI